MRLSLFIVVLIFCSCVKEILQPAFVGMVYDAETRLPIKDAEIRFIEDTFTQAYIHSRERVKQWNTDDVYRTNKKGAFKTKVYKEWYEFKHHCFHYLSWVFIVQHDLYKTDTINLDGIRKGHYRPYFALDTIWMRRPFINP